MSLGLLAGIVAAGILLVVFAVHRSGGSKPTALDDAGAAIVEFGRAYPAAAIRDVIMTADRRAAFLRLADGRAGFIQAIGSHFFARLMGPGAVRVEGTEGDRALRLGFRETTFKGGLYEFATAEDAAEVSLWLVGAIASTEQRDA